MPTGHVVNAVTGTNWEGVGVKPDVENPAGHALAKAWSLAAGRLKERVTDPQARTCLEEHSRAKLDGAPSLSSARIVGRYTVVGGLVLMGGCVTITEEDGRIHRHRAIVANGVGQVEDVLLRPAGGDRYLPEGSAWGSSSITFVMKDGKIELLQVEPRGSSVFEKQE